MEKERKPARQPEAGVHGQKDKSGFSLGRLIQFGEKAIKSEASFGVSVAALNDVALTGILVCLPFDFRVSLVCFSAAQSGAGQADPAFFAVELVSSALIDFVGKHRTGVTAELPGIVFNGSLQVTALVEIVPRGLLQETVSIAFLFVRIYAFSADPIYTFLTLGADRNMKLFRMTLTKSYILRGQTVRTIFRPNCENI